MAGPYNVLIVGCGAIAGGYDAERPADAAPLTHAAAYRRHGGFRLAACVDPDAARRDAFARRWSVDNAFADMDAAAESGPFDIVSICSPTQRHAAHLKAALRLHPKLIFAEKPLTSDLDEACKLVDACEAAGVLLAVNHTRRWAPDVVQLRNELVSGQWGTVRAANGVYNKGTLNNGAHMIDLLQYLLGSLRLIAAGEPLWDFWDDDPTIPALLTAGDVPVSLGIAHAADYALFELSIVTEGGVLVMEDGGGHWRIRRPVDSPKFVGYRVLDRGETRVGQYDQAMMRAVNEIHSVLSSGGKLSSTGRSAIEAQALCAAIRDLAVAGGRMDRRNATAHED